MEYLSMIFWLFFIFSLLTPWLKQRNLEVSRISLINRIEKERKSRIIALIHRQETMSIFRYTYNKVYQYRRFRSCFAGDKVDRSEDAD